MITLANITFFYINSLCIITSQLHHDYITVMSLFYNYYIIITNGKSCNDDSIITCSKNSVEGRPAPC